MTYKMIRLTPEAYSALVRYCGGEQLLNGVRCTLSDGILRAVKSTRPLKVYQ